MGDFIRRFRRFPQIGEGPESVPRRTAVFRSGGGPTRKAFDPTVCGYPDFRKHWIHR